MMVLVWDLPFIPCLMMCWACVFLSGFGRFVRRLSWWPRLLFLLVLFCLEWWLKLFDLWTLEDLACCSPCRYLSGAFVRSRSEFECGSFGLLSEGDFCIELKFHAWSWFVALFHLVWWETLWENLLMRNLAWGALSSSFALLGCWSCSRVPFIE